MIDKMHINCDRYIATMMMMIMTILTFKEISIIISKDIKRYKYDDLEKKFKTINKQFDDNNFINNDVNFKFESNVNINLSKRNSQSL